MHARRPAGPILFQPEAPFPVQLTGNLGQSDTFAQVPQETVVHLAERHPSADDERPRRRPPAELDTTDLRILRALNADARKSYRDIARELDIALSTVSARVKRLEESGVLTGYVPVIDPNRLGFDLVVVIGVKIAHGKLLDVQGKVAKSPRVFAVYDVTGEWDSVVLARFKDRDDLNVFIKELLANPHIERTATQLVLNTIKEEKRIVL